MSKQNFLYTPKEISMPKADAKLSNINAVVDRIILLMEKIGMRKAELARRIGLTRSAVGKLLKKEFKTLDIDRLNKIAEALHCDPIWLQYGDSSDHNVGNVLQFNSTNLTHKESIDYSIRKDKIVALKPALTWWEAESSREAMEKAMQEKSRKMIPSVEMGSEDWFPLPIENDSMSPEYTVGSYIIVDPNEKPKISDKIIVKLKDTNEILCRQYFVDGNKVILKCLNPQYKPMTTTNDNIKIIGTVLGCYKSSRPM